MWDFVMDKSGAGAGIHRELRFVFPANLNSICFFTIIFTIARGWQNRPGVAAVPIASQTKLKTKNRREDLLLHCRLYPLSHAPTSRCVTPFDRTGLKM
jgi:hypothetical protein